MNFQSLAATLLLHFFYTTSALLREVYFSKGVFFKSVFLQKCILRNDTNEKDFCSQSVFFQSVFFKKCIFQEVYFSICTLLACLLSFASLFLFHSFPALLYKLRTMTRELRTWWCLIPSSHHEPARVKQENLTNKPTFMNQQFSAKWFSSKYSQWASP